MPISNNTGLKMVPLMPKGLSSVSELYITLKVRQTAFLVWWPGTKRESVRDRDRQIDRERETERWERERQRQ